MGDRRLPGCPVADHQRRPASRRCGLGRGPRISARLATPCMAARARLVPVPVDGHGMRVDTAIKQAPKARLALVTPTHQSPLGVTLSLERRLSLLAWAAQAGAWILEDDYDSEFRYTGHPLPALKSLDHADRVLFAGSFSKVLFPGLRLGYLVVPDPLTKDIARASRLLQVGQSVLEQRVVASFMAEGHFARHLRRMRSLYAARRDALAERTWRGVRRSHQTAVASRWHAPDRTVHRRPRRPRTGTPRPGSRPCTSRSVEPDRAASVRHGAATWLHQHPGNRGSGCSRPIGQRDPLWNSRLRW